MVFLIWFILYEISIAESSTLKAWFTCMTSIGASMSTRNLCVNQNNFLFVWKFAHSHFGFKFGSSRATNCHCFCVYHILLMLILHVNIPVLVLALTLYV